MEDDLGIRRYRGSRQVHNVAAEAGDREGGGDGRGRGHVEQREAGDGAAAEAAFGGEPRGDPAAEKPAAAENGYLHGCCLQQAGRSGPQQ